MTTTVPEPRPRLGELLGATDDREAEAFEDAVARTLALLAPEVEPPESLRAAIFAQLDAPEAPSASGVAAPDVAARAASVRRPAGDRSAPVGDRGTSRPAGRGRASSRPGHRSRRNRLVGVVAGFAAALVVVAGVMGVSHALEAPRAGTTSALASITAAPDAQRITTTFHGGAASVAVDASATVGRSVAVITGAPASKTGTTYELWYIRGVKATPAGLFQPSASGSATVTLHGRYQSGDLIAATIEPSGGSQQPTAAPVFELQS